MIKSSYSQNFTASKGLMFLADSKEQAEYMQEEYLAWPGGSWPDWSAQFEATRGGAPLSPRAGKSRVHRDHMMEGKRTMSESNDELYARRATQADVHRGKPAAKRVQASNDFERRAAEAAAYRGVVEVKHEAADNVYAKRAAEAAAYRI